MLWVLRTGAPWRHMLVSMPEPLRPASWDRYAYVLNNPLRYADPSGHKYDPGGVGGKCDSCLSKVHQDHLYSKIFRGSNEDGSWTVGDWKIYHQNRESFWSNPLSWINPDPDGWESFVLHVRRLASLYGVNEKEEFVRDFALVFGGIAYDDPWYRAALEVVHGPKDLQFVMENNAGLAPIYIDTLRPGENQSHHYVGLFFLSYFTDPEIAIFTNSFLRDRDNPGDILLGNRAAIDAYVFRFYRSDPVDLAGLIAELAIP